MLFVFTHKIYCAVSIGMKNYTVIRYTYVDFALELIFIEITLSHCVSTVIKHVLS